MKDPMFYTKGGKLTSYGLACGYVEQVEGPKYRLQLFMEHAHYHVIEIDKITHKRIWETFDGNELTKARKLFHQLKMKRNKESKSLV